MRILHVANFNLYKYGTDLYATDRKISAGLTRNGHFVYDFSYRDICRNESLLRTTRFSNKKVNARLIQAVQTIQPDILLLGHSELIEAATLAEVKRIYPGIKIGLWYVDALFHKEKMTHVFARLPWLDTLFATTGGELLQAMAQGSARATFIPNMIDPAVESVRSFASDAPAYDFVFCGRDSGDSERNRFMTRLYEETVKEIRVAFRGCLHHPPVTGAAYLELLAQSRMGLNISRRNDVFMYSSDRLAQLTGCGLLTFCPRVPGMTTLFSENELVYFETIDNLLEKIRYYYRNDAEARQIAENGWRKAHQSYNCTRVTRFMLECLTEEPFSEQYEWREEMYNAR